MPPFALTHQARTIFLAQTSHAQVASPCLDGCMTPWSQVCQKQRQLPQWSPTAEPYAGNSWIACRQAGRVGTSDKQPPRQQLFNH
eukprot:2166478-Amphidinium_carterae.2